MQRLPIQHSIRIVPNLAAIWGQPIRPKTQKGSRGSPIARPLFAKSSSGGGFFGGVAGFVFGTFGGDVAVNQLDDGAGRAVAEAEAGF
jgi:hypothetical protein